MKFNESDLSKLSRKFMWQTREGALVHAFVRGAGKSLCAQVNRKDGAKWSGRMVGWFFWCQNCRRIATARLK